MLQTFQQMQFVVLRRAFIILKPWCFSLVFSSLLSLSQSRCFMFMGSVSVFQLMKMYFVSFWVQELPASVPVPLITSLMAQPELLSLQVHFPPQQMGQTNTTWSKLWVLKPTPGAKVTQGTPRQLGCKCFGSFQGCKKARGAGDWIISPSSFTKFPLLDLLESQVLLSQFLMPLLILLRETLKTAVTLMLTFVQTGPILWLKMAGNDESCTHWNGPCVLNGLNCCL